MFFRSILATSIALAADCPFGFENDSPKRSLATSDDVDVSDDYINTPSDIFNCDGAHPVTDVAGWLLAKETKYDEIADLFLNRP